MAESFPKPRPPPGIRPRARSSSAMLDVSDGGDSPPPILDPVDELLTRFLENEGGLRCPDLAFEFIRDVHHMKRTVADDLVKFETKMSKLTMKGVMDVVDKFPGLCLNMAAAIVRLQSRVTELETTVESCQVLVSTVGDIKGEIKSLKELGCCGSSNELESVVSSCRGLVASVDEVRAELVGVKAALAAAPVATPSVTVVPPIPVAPARIGSYADALSAPPRPVRKVNVVQVGPAPGASGLDSADLVKAAMMGAVKPADSGWQVVGVRARGKAVMLSLGSGEAASRVLNSSALAKAGLVASTVGKARPRITIFDVPRSVTPDQCLSYLKTQNFPDAPAFGADAWGAFSHEFGGRGAATRNVVLRVDPKIRDLILSKGRIYIEWSCCRVKDYVGVTRCWQCQDYGHIKKDCRRVGVCRHCAEEGHIASACPKSGEPAVCPPCKYMKRPHNHSMDDLANCPSYQRMFRRAVDRTDYHG